MSEIATHHRFLRRVRRRWVFWRALEWAALGAFAMAVVGFAIVPVLMWRGADTIRPALMLLAIGAGAGLLAGLTRRPTLLRTAVEADRQLGLADLLSTVASKQTFGDDAFTSVVLAQAQQMCAARSPNELVLRRLGARAWGGMGITAALLLTVAMMFSQPERTRALSGAGEGVRGTTDGGRDSQPSAADRLGSWNAQNQRETASAGRKPSQDDAGLPARSGNDPQRATRDSLDRNPSQSGSGAGASAGRSADANVPPVRTVSSSQPGVIEGTDAPNSMARQSGGAPAPPWQSAQWPADRARASEQLRSGAVPDAYRDLVRDYFDRDRENPQ